MVVLDVEKPPPPEVQELEQERNGVDDPLLPVTTRKSPKAGRRLSQRGRWWMRLGSVLFVLVFIKAMILRREEKDFEFLQSLVNHDDVPTSHFDRGFGCLGIALDPKKVEKLFLSIPSPKSALDASRKYATHPHLAGSVEDFEDAKVILELFQTQFGIPLPEEEPIFPAGTSESRKATLDATKLTSPQAWIDVYYPVMNTPLDHSLEILDEAGEVVWAADLEEDGDSRDREAGEYKDAVPAWHGLSKGGEVEGELVYANYGTKEDYEELVASGVDLKGKIVVTRYGSIFRGLKIKGAQELGAAGVLIYTDPRDDGAVTVENGYAPYPAGPARNPTSVQRGSVQFLSIYPGDPTTPGVPAYENATRMDGVNIPTIPSLPISWRNAERLLEEIGESAGNRVISGKASARRVRLVNHVDDKVMPIWNTMAVIPGHIRNEVVVVGNHRDAWVMGAADPTSGTVSLHEIVRGFGALLRSGWRPLRTIMFASWDAEEYGLVGSTEWGEDFPDWISAHVVAYLNVDVSVAGSRWNVAASPSLAHLIAQTAKDVPHPTKTGMTLWDARLDDGPFEGTIDPDFNKIYNASLARDSASKTGVLPLGSGSDFTVFLQRLGIASADQGFGGTPHDAPYHYHSIYDSQRWQEKYADPGFHRHVAVAKNLGLLILRVSSSITLPLNTTQYALELDDYLLKVEDIASTMSETPNFSPLRKSIKKLQKASLALDEEKTKAEAKFRKLLEKMQQNMLKNHTRECPEHTGVWGRIRTWIKGVFGVKGKPQHAHGERHRLQIENALKALYDHRDSDDAGLSEFDLDLVLPPIHEGTHAYPQPALHFLGDIPIRKFIKAAKRVESANQKLVAFERGFISEAGIKDREWYRHLGVAPGKWLGYGATTFPALTEALTIDKNVTLADFEAGRLKSLLDKLATTIAV